MTLSHRGLNIIHSGFPDWISAPHRLHARGSCSRGHVYSHSVVRRIISADLLLNQHKPWTLEETHNLIMKVCSVLFIALVAVASATDTQPGTSCEDPGCFDLESMASVRFVEVLPPFISLTLFQYLHWLSLQNATWLLSVNPRIWTFLSSPTGNSSIMSTKFLGSASRST
jgi:hypothetical protein